MEKTANITNVFRTEKDKIKKNKMIVPNNSKSMIGS